MDLKNVTALNVNSLISHSRYQLLLDFIIDNPSFIFFLGETHLKPNATLHVPNFNFFNAPRYRCNGGGAALLVRDGIPIRNFRAITNDSFEAAVIELLLNGIWITFCSVYFAPSSGGHCGAFATLITSLGDSFIMGGDFNARLPNMPNTSSNTFGNYIACNYLNDPDIRLILPDSPTCFRSATGSFIDFFVTSRTLFTSSPSLTQSFSFSDHTSITLPCNFSCELFDVNSARTILLYPYTNIGAMNKFLEENLYDLLIPTTSNLSIEQLDENALNIQNIFLKAIGRFVPVATISPTKILPSCQTLALRRQLRRVGSILSKNPFHHSRIALVRDYKSLTLMYQNSLTYDRRSHFALITSVTASNRQVFDLVRKSKRKTIGMESIQSIVDVDDLTVVTDQFKIRDCFANRFQAQHETTFNQNSLFSGSVRGSLALLDANVHDHIQFNDTCTPEIISDDMLNILNQNLPELQKDLLTSLPELTNIISQKTNKKSTGSDKMPIHLFKFFSPNILLFLVIFFNHLIARSHFPAIWRHAIITPIPKVGKDSSYVNNWRPISQLDTISKLFEKIIDIRLSRSLGGILPDFQFGFSAAKSTLHPLVRFTNNTVSALNGGNITTVLALDIQSAFDTVWHDGVIHKMIRFGINPFIVKIIQRFLTNRTFVVGKSVQSSVRRIVAGVPQGSVLGPKIFNIFLADIPTRRGIRLLQYADDILIYVIHKAPLASSKLINAYLKTLTDFYSHWKLRINVGKTTLTNIVGTGCVTKKLRDQLRTKQKIVINGTVVRPISSFKYLGVIFTANFKFIQHINHIIKRVNIASVSLGGTLRNRFLNTKFRLFIYKMYIRPIIQYASAVWLNPTLTSAHQVERIRIIERRIIRSAGSIRRPVGTFKYINNKLLYKLVSIDRIDRFLVNINVKFFRRCLGSANDFIRGLVEPFNINRKLNFPSFVFHLNNADQLFTPDNRLMVFHRGHNNPHSVVYNTNQ